MVRVLITDTVRLIRHGNDDDVVAMVRALGERPKDVRDRAGRSRNRGARSERAAPEAARFIRTFIADSAAFYAEHPLPKPLRFTRNSQRSIRDGITRYRSVPFAVPFSRKARCVATGRVRRCVFGDRMRRGGGLGVGRGLNL